MSYSPHSHYGRETTQMTAFDLFQRATCEIAEGDRRAAIVSLNKAILAADATGADKDLRGELVDLRGLLIRVGV